jgi:hypothetical protein
MTVAPTGENQTTARPEHRRTMAWFHCFAGIAGDMALGSLIDAGADIDEVRLLLDRLALPGWELQIEETLRGGVACTRHWCAAATTPLSAPTPHRRPDHRGRPPER